MLFNCFYLYKFDKNIFIDFQYLFNLHTFSKFDKNIKTKITLN